MVSKTNKKFLLLGVGRSGKDTLAEFLRDEYGYTFQSSSYAAAEIFIFDALKEALGYKTVQECFDDRHNHRELWFNMIKEYNKDDKARLAKKILETSDCYVGMRSEEELQECVRQGLFDKIIWVMRGSASESEDSCTVKPHMAQYFVDNNSDLDTLRNVGAKYVHHILTDDSLTGFVTNNSLHYGQYLESETWNSGDVRPVVAGQYKIIAHDIVSSWYEKAYYDGKYWLTNEGGGHYPCVIDKWKGV